MLKLIDFDEMPIVRGLYYGGNAGAKDAILFDNAGWMVKFPKSTRELKNPQISYTTSPISEYLGSKVYEAFEIPVHETVLGTRRNKVVVACRDFTRILGYPMKGAENVLWLERMLVPFHDLKNSFMSSDIDAYSGAGSETLLDEVLATISGQDDLKAIPGVTERFWDMFVIDAFIGNNDRNNGNWGILIDPKTGEMSLAPVYDNGSAFFNKRSLDQMQKRLLDETAMQEDAYKTAACAYKYVGLDNEGHRINPFNFMRNGGNADCEAAIKRFVDKLKMERIAEIIQDIPEEIGTLAVMPNVQKEFYIKLLEIRAQYIIDSE
ncbi:MAG: HipA domain-containing protein [Defluviitaleaceae bacterium]|nr:HipA domain-containing protein [Defluviitaleaceae bacterium]